MRATYNAVVRYYPSRCDVTIPELAGRQIIASYKTRDLMLANIAQDVQTYTWEWFNAIANRGQRLPDPATETVPVTVALPY